MLLDDDDFTVLEERKAMKTTPEGEGGFVEYTKKHPLYTELNMYEKMNYALFLTKYNVNENRAYGEGMSVFTEEGQKKWKYFFPTNYFTGIARLNSLLVYVSFLCWIFMILLLAFVAIFRVLLYFGSASTDYLLATTYRIQNVGIGIMLMLFLAIIVRGINWFKEKAMNRIEILQYYIK